MEWSAKSECQRAGKIRRFFLLALTLRLSPQSHSFYNFWPKTVLMETGVKTNEDMYPLNHDFFLLSFFLLFFFFDISATSRGLFGGEQVQVNVFKISWSFARLWHTTLKLGKFTTSFNAIFVAVYLCFLTGPHQKLKTPWNCCWWGWMWPQMLAFSRTNKNKFNR